MGGVGISNLINVVPKVCVVDVKVRIENALERDATLEAQAIRVDVSAGKVTLKGKAKIWSERRAAERAPWSVSGITQLDDQLSMG